MRPPPPLGQSFFARWTSRIAVFSVGVLATAIALHRLFGLPSPVAFNLARLAFAGAVLSLLFALFATVGIWRTGRPGTPRIVFAILVSLGLLAWPLIYLPQYESLPKINDITTDAVNPPAFVAIAKLRGPGANPIAYPGAALAKAQAAAYPDIKGIELNRSVDEAFEVATDAVRHLKLNVVGQEAPNPKTGAPGLIEIVDRSMIVGFYDDVVIRVWGNDESARIDVRSQSRFGSFDLGRNADHVRQLLKDFVVRMESVIPAEHQKGVAKAKDDVKEEQQRNRRLRRPRR
jgi:uncharacterized protein (DUF1499 family)